MQRRFKQYLGVKMISQKDIAMATGLTEGQVSRFCKNGTISLENFKKILFVCQDLSLEYFFYGTGPVIKPSCPEKSGNSINNVTHNYSGSASLSKMDIHQESGTHGVETENLLALISEKDKLIAAKDDTITKRDETISRLSKLLEKLADQ